jgi:hypothetical protein
MKVLIVGNFGRSWDGSICDEEHIARAFERLGHEAIRSQRGQTNAYLSGNDDPYDAILMAQWDGYHPDFVKNTKEYFDCPVVYWAFDYQADGQEWHERLIGEVDLYLSKRVADSKYPNWQYFSQDFAPDFLEMVDPVEKDIDVLFTGSYLDWATERNETLKLVDDNFNLTIHTVTPDQFRAQGFKHVYGPMMDDELPQLIARAKVNFSVDHTIERGYWSDRNAQIICCGGFVLSRHVPMMEQRFNNNIAYYHGKDDALDAVEYWLEHEEDREVIAAEGYELSHYYKVEQKVANLITLMNGTVL